ncbi:hypothetical protein ACFXTO_011976 [Malus domestica]
MYKPTPSSSFSSSSATPILESPPPRTPQQKKDEQLISKEDDEIVDSGTTNEPRRSGARRCRKRRVVRWRACRWRASIISRYWDSAVRIRWGMCRSRWESLDRCCSTKKESHCPLCRRRLTTIRRLPRDGVFARERVGKIPACDHAHHPSSNMVGQVLRHEEASCQVCPGMADEYLLLLCDICDSAAHTYCVGLGNTVPEGDWFCLDCTTIRGEHDDNVDSSFDSDDEYLLGPSDPNISAFDIEQESYGHISAANRYLPRIPRIPDHFALPVVRDRSTSIADEVITTPAETLPSVAASGARTLVHRRYVCTRVQELRENWNVIQMPKNGVIIHERSGQTQSSSSTSGQQPRNRDSCGLSDIDKAWK